MLTEGAAEPGELPRDSDDSPHAASSSDQRQGMFLEGAVVVNSNVIGYAGQVIQDPDAPYNVRSLANPYLGLRSFTYADRAIYAGRTRLIADTVARIPAPGEQQVLVFVTGASGSGKSSFAQAGLVPALEEYYRARSITLRRAVIRPSRHPLSQLADAFKQLGLGVATAAPVDGSVISEVLTANSDASAVNVIIIDQFEELFSQSESPERDAVFAWLGQLPSFADVRTHLICTMRSDYLPDLFAHPALYEVAKRGVDLRAMGEAELREAIQAPLRQVQLQGNPRFEDALLERLARETATDGTYLPLLQVTLEDLWSRGLLKLSAYGTLSDAIRDRAERVYGFVDHQGAASQPRSTDEQAAIAAIFLDLVTVSLDDDARHDVRRRRTWDELVGRSGLRARLVEELVTSRLLSRGVEMLDDRQVDVVDIIHETLIAKWERVRGWIDGQHDSLQQRVRFEQALMMWSEHGQADEYLLGGVGLAEAEALAQLGNVALSSGTARYFLQQSINRQSERRRRELRRTRSIAVVLSILLVIATVAAATAYYQTKIAEARRVRTEAQALAAQSQVEREKNPDLALLLAVEAASRDQTSMVEQALRQSILDAPITLRHYNTVFDAAYSPDGREFATVGGNEVKVWEARTGTLIRSFQHKKGLVSSIAYSSDGKKLLSGGSDGTVKVWDEDSNQELMSVEYSEGLVYSIDVEMGGDRVVTVGDDGVARVWSVSTGQKILDIRYEYSKINRASFSPDGREVVTAHLNGEANIWDSHNGRLLRTLKGHDGMLRSAKYSGDGKYIVTSGLDKTCRVWEASTGDMLRVLQGHTERVTKAVFASGGNVIVSASADKTIRLWSVQTGKLLRVLEGHSDAIAGVVVSPQDDMLSFGRDGTARVWNIDDGREKLAISPHPAAIYYADFSPNGESVVTAGMDAKAKIWDVHSGKLRFDLVHGQIVSMASYSPDGHRIATASGWNMTVWDAENGKRTLTITDTYPLNSVQFSPDGRDIATSYVTSTLIVIRDSLTGEIKNTLRGDRFHLIRPVYSPDGTKIAAMSGEYLHFIDVWDLRSGKMILRIDRGTPINQVVFSPDGSEILSPGADLRVDIFNAIDGRKKRQISDKDLGTGLRETYSASDEVVSAEYSPDMRFIVTASADQKIKLWDSQSSRVIREFSGHSSLIIRSSFSRDGKYILSASIDGSARIWSISGSFEDYPLEGSNSAVYNVEYSPDGRQAAGSGDDGAVWVWDVHTGKVIQRYSADGPVGVVRYNSKGDFLLVAGAISGNIGLMNVSDGKMAISYAPLSSGIFNASFDKESNRVLACSQDGHLRMWDAKTGTVLLDLSRDEAKCSASSFSSDGSEIAIVQNSNLPSITGEKNVSIVDAVSGKSRLKFIGHDQGIRSVIFSPDGRYFATGSRDTTVKIWETRTGRVVMQLSGHRGTISGIAYSSDGMYIATSSFDGTARLWDTKTGELRSILYGHTGIVTGVSFSSDGNRVIVSGYDGTCRQYYTHIKDLVALAQERANRPMSPEERSKYLQN